MFDIKAKIEFDTRNKIIQMHVFLNNFQNNFKFHNQKLITFAESKTDQKDSPSGPIIDN